MPTRYLKQELTWSSILAIVFVLSACSSSATQAGDETSSNSDQGESVARSQTTENSDPQRSIRASITPGKPGAPTEIVEVIFRSDSCDITIVRQAPAGSSDESIPTETNTKTLAGDDAQACAEPFKVVDEAELMAFEVGGAKERPIDGSSYEIEIVTITELQTSSKLIAWDSEIDNEDSLHEVLRSMSDLARSVIDSPRLWYFPTG